MCVNVNINKQGKLKNFSTCMIENKLQVRLQYLIFVSQFHAFYK